MDHGGYISGGYYLTRRVPRRENMRPELMPEQVLSASGCVCDFFPNTWAIAWTTDSVEERSAQAAQFGLDEAQLPGVIEWATAGFGEEFGWPNAFYSLDAARAAQARFLQGSRDVVLFGLGLQAAHAERFVEYTRPEPPKPGCAPVGVTGIVQCVSAGRRIEPGGARGGFELIATYLFGALSCSWLCNGLEAVFAERAGVRPNAHGFIETFDQAERCRELIEREEVPAEPGLWLPWLVTIYEG